MTPDGLPRIPYGSRTLAEVLPSAIAALTGDGPNPLDQPPTRSVVVLLVDGLGWSLLRRASAVAPTLAAADAQPLSTGFPSTTVASLATLGTGTPPGEHGLVGYTSWIPAVSAVVNWLSWRHVGPGAADLRERLVPERVQPHPTRFERAAAAGVAVTVTSAPEFATSGMTRAALRGGRYIGTISPGDAIATVADAARAPRSLVYCYLSELDLIGHVRGPDADAWTDQLAVIDGFVARLRGRLPADASLLVTGDHGMVHVPEHAKIDYDARPDLRDGVVALAGEPRARYVHVSPGALDDVRAAWTSTLGDAFHVLTRAEAIAAGLFGPTVTAIASARIGDLIVLARTDGAIVQRTVESRLSQLPGLHGSLTDDERLVPLLNVR